MASADFVDGNALALLNSGAEFFPALIAAIEAAQRDIHLETYIFAADCSGLAVAQALIAAAARGVAVRVLVDGYGSPDFAQTLQPRLAAAGVMALVYRPELKRFRLRRHRLRRLHRKLTLIDGEVAFVGGINIVDDLADADRSPGRYDYAVRVEGPLAQPIAHSMRRLWEIATWVSHKRRFRLTQGGTPQLAPRGEQRAAFVVRDNIRHRRDIEDSYLAAIAGARHSIVLANAYFLPGRRFRQALLAAARRGVNVILITQGWTDHPLQQRATRALYGQFLAGGVRIFEYHLSHLHAKVAVVDERWATVGSSNIDPFSLLLAREANVVVRDNAFAGDLHHRLRRVMKDGSREISAVDWQRGPRLQRLINWVAYGLVRLMIGLAGYGGRH